jgi:hypothetical protein
VNHLRFAGAGADVQRAALTRIVQDSPVLMRTLRGLHDLALPDGWLVSGAIYNQVWNALTGRPEMHGVKDIDLFCFDPDTSWEDEDRQIRRAAALFPGEPPVELRNQARVHLWYGRHFGRELPRAYQSSCDGIDHFAALTHCVAVRLGAGGPQVYAPYGLDPIFRFALVPNPRLDNRETFAAKAARQCAIWPELNVESWPDGPDQA